VNEHFTNTKITKWVWSCYEHVRHYMMYSGAGLWHAVPTTGDPWEWYMVLNYVGSKLYHINILKYFLQIE
jgi:hypothetical protein